jgi:hypothetical protein
MSQVVKNIQVTWSWSGDSSSIRKFNVVIAPNGVDPNTTADLIAQASVEGTLSGHIFQNVILNAGSDYNAWVQAAYQGKDSAWINSGGLSVVDDGVATISGVRTFTSEPTVPYNVGDVWMDANNIKRCITGQDNLGSFDDAHWANQASTSNLNLLHPEVEWIAGTTGSQGSFIQNGTSAENEIDFSIGPFGSDEEIWTCRPDAGNDADGGWTHNIVIDPTKAYIWGVYVKTYTNDGTTYLGCGTVEDLGTYVENTNPYFFNDDLPENSTWHLVLGKVHPAGFTGSDTGLSGVYEVSTGSKVDDGVEFRFKASTTSQQHRCFHNYNTENTGLVVQDMARPFVMLASEMQSIDQLTTKLSGIEAGADSTNTALNNPSEALQMKYGTLEVGVDASSQGIIKSANFVSDGTGWAIDGNGSAEFGDVVVRGAVVSSSLSSNALTLRGSHLTLAAPTSATTLNVHNTTDFTTSGSGWIIDRNNDKDTFSWTGKTLTTLTGCTGVLSHLKFATVIPKAPNIILDINSQELRVYGYNTSSNLYSTSEQLVTMGIKDVGDGGSGTDQAIMKVGNDTFSRGVPLYCENTSTTSPTFSVRNYNSSTSGGYALNAVHKSAGGTRGFGGGYFEGHIGIVSKGNSHAIEAQNTTSGTANTSAIKAYYQPSSYGNSTYGIVSYCTDVTASIYGYHSGVRTGTAGVLGVGYYCGVHGEANTSASARGVLGKSTKTGVWGDGGVYNFYAAGTGTDYGTFTGGHDALIPSNSNHNLGDIYVDKELIYIRELSMSNTITSVEISSTPKQKNIIGIMALYNNITLEEELPAVFTEMSTEGKLIMLEQWDVAIINALGEGLINVCSEGGNIEAGDYICSSSTHGKGMLQDDDLLHNYTVAKSRQDVVWTQDEIDNNIIKMIACTYHCG